MKNLIGISYSRRASNENTKLSAETDQYQQAEVERYAKENQIKLIKRFSDIGYSGLNTNRPALQEMLTLLRDSSQHINTLLMHSPKHLGRDPGNYINLMREIADHVNRVVFVEENQSSSSKVFAVVSTMAKEYGISEEKVSH